MWRRTEKSDPRKKKLFLCLTTVVSNRRSRPCFFGLAGTWRVVGLAEHDLGHDHGAEILLGRGMVASVLPCIIFWGGKEDPKIQKSKKNITVMPLDHQRKKKTNKQNGGTPAFSFSTHSGLRVKVALGRVGAEVDAVAKALPDPSASVA